MDPTDYLIPSIAKQLHKRQTQIYQEAAELNAMRKGIRETITDEDRAGGWRKHQVTRKEWGAISACREQMAALEGEAVAYSTILELLLTPAARKRQTDDVWRKLDRRRPGGIQWTPRSDSSPQT